MATFKIATPAMASFTTAGGGYEYEMEPLAGMDVEIVEGPADEDGFIAFAQDADAVYAKGMRFTRKVVEALPAKCRAIVLGSVGVDSVDVQAATERGMPVTNCPDTFIEEVADHAMTLLLSTFRRVIEQDRMVREGRWREGRPALLQIPRLMGQTLGLIAFGHVARAVARRAKAFGLRVIAYDPFIEELVMVENGVLPVTLEEVLSQSDFVSMHAPATPEAEGMLTEKHFRLMKPTAIFINTGRGPTVQEAGLIKALEEKWIAYAGLDVLEIEPPGHNNPLLSMDNVILSAHTASASSRFDPARKRHVGRELSLVLNGKWPMSCVNPAVHDPTGP
jgi:D-3-phosphoglycerate dehydrogenase